MKKIKIIIGVIFCIMAILSAIAASLMCSLYYDLSVINKQLFVILIYILLVLMVLFIVAGAILIAFGVSKD